MQLICSWLTWRSALLAPAGQSQTIMALKMRSVPHARRQNCTEALWPNSAPPAPMVLHGEQQETMSLLKMEQGQWTNELELSD